MKEYHNDSIIKFQYNPVYNATITPLNAVGATDSSTLRTLGFVPSDANTIYVSKSGDDSYAGTYALPVLTIEEANSKVTAVKTHIIILDSGVYEEEAFVFSSDCVGVYSALEQTPSIKPATENFNSYIIETLLTETQANTTQVSGNEIYPETQIFTLSNGNFLEVWTYTDNNGSTKGTKFRIFDEDGANVVTETDVELYNAKVTSLNDGYFVIAGNVGQWNEGIDWEAISAVEQLQWYDVDTDGAGVFIAVTEETGDNRIMRSTNYGDSWSIVTLPNNITAQASIRYGGGVWVICATAVGTNNNLFVSTNNGVSWTGKTYYGFTTGDYLTKLHYSSNGTWVIAGGESGNATRFTLRSTDDGDNWSRTDFITSGSANRTLNGLGSDGSGTWLLFSNYSAGGGIYYNQTWRSTDDGINWSQVTNQFTHGGSHDNYSFVDAQYKDDGSFCILGAGGHLFKSTDDGDTWSTLTIGISGIYPHYIDYAEGVWLAYDVDNTRLARSIDDGASNTWAEITLPEANTFIRFAYGNEVWIGVSPDGTYRVVKSEVERNIKYTVYTNSGGVSYSKEDTFIGKVQTLCAQDESLGDNRFLVTYYDPSGDNSTYGFIDNYAGTRIVSPFTISIATDHLRGLQDSMALSDGGFALVAWLSEDYETETYKPELLLITSSGSVSDNVDLESSLSAGYENGSIKIIGGESSSYLAIAYSTSTIRAYLSEYSISTLSQVGKIIIPSSGSYQFAPHGLQKLRDGVFIVSGNEIDSGSATGKYFALSVDFSESSYTEIETETFTNLNKYVACVYNASYERVMFSGMQQDTYGEQYDVYIKLIGGFVWDWLTVTESIILNGIIFDNSLNGIHRYFNASNTDTGTVINILWCTLQNIEKTGYNNEGDYPTKIMVSDALTNVINNCKILVSYGGFDLTSDDVSILECQFVEVTQGYGVSITGSGSGIIISHCDFLRGYGGVELLANNGNEIVKNNNYYSLSTYSIKSAAAIVYSNSINAGIVTSNVTAGSSVLKTNPLYINDGSESISLLNLNVKQKVLGYGFDSPAINLADDGKNSGSFDIDLGDTSKTWDEITVEKGLIQVSYEPIGAGFVPYKNGRIRNYRDAYKEVVQIIWSGLLVADKTSLLDMLIGDDDTIRIYPDPTTNPYSYNTYSIVYDIMNSSPLDSNKLSETGVNDLVLTFSRPYN